MKYLTLIFFVILIYSSCRTDNSQLLCEPSQDAFEWFEHDAYALSIKTIFDTTNSTYHLYQDSVHIPNQLYDSIVSKLAFVYDNNSHIERDTIINIHRIHVYPIYERGVLLMRLCKEESWVNQFINGEEIEDEAIKNILDKYDVVFNEIFTENDTIIRVRAAVQPELNLIAVANEIEERIELDSCTVYCYPNGYGGDGNDIELIFNSGDIEEVHFSVGTGDCPSGCIYREFWKFGINEDCSVTFLGK